MQGFKRSQPQIYQSEPNELQNHLISYKRETDNSSMAVDALYHIENYNLPVSQGNINRQVESFHGGLGIERNWKKITLSVQPVFQFSQINRWSTKTTNLTVWNMLNSEYHTQIQALKDYIQVLEQKLMKNPVKKVTQDNSTQTVGGVKNISLVITEDN